MKEIKYRAWLSEDEEMMSWMCMMQNAFNYPEGKHLLVDCIRDHKIKMMQFTGRQDINGNDIYEGDLVLCVGAISGKGWDEAGNVIGLVKEDPKDFGWTIIILKEGTKYAYGCMNYSSLEVVGNIYEDQDILQQNGFDEGIKI
jgi:uncharacterized phage protein (TIGR01671 family)